VDRDRVMTNLPVAEIYAVQLPGDGPQQCIGRVTVRCPWCKTLHTHRIWTNDSTTPTRTAPCTSDHPVLQYVIDLNVSVSVPKRDVSHPHPVHTAGENRDDNAFNETEPNWIE
jgi:hypothetical protein